MKKIIISLVLALLLLIVFFQFRNYRRLNPPNQYEFPINNAIDVNYYNPVMVKDYYKGCFEIGTFAREQWYNDRIDVLFPNRKSEQSMRASETYNIMRSKVKEIENRLLNSAKLKELGYSNYDIEEMERRGIGTKEYDFNKNFEFVNLKFGDENQSVLEMQKSLYDLGYSLRRDGIFNKETEGVVKQYQQKNGLYASGIADKRTLMKIMNEKPSSAGAVDDKK